MKCQTLFSGKKKEKYFKVSSAEFFTQHAKHLSGKVYLVCELLYCFMIH